MKGDFGEAAAAQKQKPKEGELVAAVGVNSLKFGEEIPAEKRAALEKQYIEAVKDLLARGADIDEKDDTGMTALMWAARLGFTGLAQWLVDKGALLDRRGCHGLGFTALSWAVAYCRADIVRLLIEAGSPTEIRDFQDSTLEPLNKKNPALREAADAIAKMLENAPALRQRAVDRARKTAVHAAAVRKQKYLSGLAPPVTIIKSANPREKPCP